MYQRIGHTLNLIILSALVICGLLYHFSGGSNDFAAAIISVIKNPENAVPIVLVLLFIGISNLSLIASNFLPQGNQEKIRISNHDGQIEFNSAAMEDTLVESIEARAEINECEIRITAIEEPEQFVTIQATLSLWEIGGASSLEYTEQIQSILKQRFLEILPLECDMQFNVLINKISNKPVKKELPISEVDSTPQYPGPQYPDPKKKSS